MKAIAAADKNWGIGYENKLLTSIPEDMKFFRHTTSGHVVVMGRRTLESFPNQAPLPKRTNIVLSTNPSFKRDDVVIVRSLDELHEELKKYDSDDIFVIGGEKVYKELIDECDTAYITRSDYAFQADAHFPDLDKDPAWKMTEESDEQTYFNLCYNFCVYKRMQ